MFLLIIVSHFEILQDPSLTSEQEYKAQHFPCLFDSGDLFFMDQIERKELNKICFGANPRLQNISKWKELQSQAVF